MQSSFKKHFQLIVIQKLWDWRLERCYMKNDICLFDHHQKSHWDTITIGPKGMMNWALQLNNSQSVKLFDSLLEKFNVLNSPNQPNPNPNQFVTDQGNLTARKMCLLSKMKRPFPRDWMKKRLHEELGSSNRSGKPDNLSEKHPFEQTHDGSGQPDEQNSSSAHTVKEQFAPEENRDIASFNTDNEFNRAINEEDIDFNIPGLPHSTVKQSHGANVQDLIQKIENHPQRHALQSDLQQRQQFNPFNKESKDMIREIGNIEMCELLDVQPKAQCKICLSYWDVGIVYCTYGHFLRNGTEENKKFVKLVLDFFSIPNYYIKKGRRQGPRYGKKQGDHEYFNANCSRRNARRDISWAWWEIPKGHDWIGSQWRNMSWDGQNWRTRITRTTLLQMKFECIATTGGAVPICWFRHDARKASSWFQRSLNKLATTQEPRGYNLFPKLVAKLFLSLVELARILVVFFIWASPRRWTQHRWIGETWWTMIGPIIWGMILRITLV